MCGIIGYIGNKNCLEILIEGLEKLEYRGYDSAGIVLLAESGIKVVKSEGKLHNLKDKIANIDFSASCGIAHTRWATHGKPNEINAHPHISKNVAIVHNGIIENYSDIKLFLENQGYKFVSETDTEVLAHLIDFFSKQKPTFKEAIIASLKMVKGSYALGILNLRDTNTLYAAKKNSPLLIGVGENEKYIASDVTAIIKYTKDIIYLNDDEIAEFTESSVKVYNLDGIPVKKEVKQVSWNPLIAEKGGFKHFMLKEIHEQATAITDTLSGRLDKNRHEIVLPELEDLKSRIEVLKKIVIVACGTSYHAGLIGKFILEKYTRIPVEVDLSSEFRYRDPIIDNDMLVIPISQSGETADTIAAVEEAKSKMAPILSICNVEEATIPRKAHYNLYTHAGPEIGVASTKAFTTQLLILYMLAYYIGKTKRLLTAKTEREFINNLISLPAHISSILANEDKIEAIARKYFKVSDFLYLARGINYPIALEGALKLKEISYIHAEGYPAGEMKHGPIALIDENVPVIIIASKSHLYDKVISNLEEVKARNGITIVLCTENDLSIKSKADDYFAIPEIDEDFSPFLTVVPLQLLAYHAAVLKGTDVDQPRNLAKSVTVE